MLQQHFFKLFLEFIVFQHNSVYNFYKSIKYIIKSIINFALLFIFINYFYDS